jgi:osmotically-inducible protein OsmY
MKNFIIALLVGVILGGVGVWYYLDGREKSPVQKAEQHVKSAAETAKESVATAAERAKEAIQQKWPDLDAEKIKDELARTGQVVRRKVREAGETIADAASDARITATIKAKLVKDPSLSAWDISVSTTDGRVTLSGKVSSPEQIAHAMRLALETDGVNEVVSTLQIQTQD